MSSFGDFGDQTSKAGWFLIIFFPMKSCWILNPCVCSCFFLYPLVMTNSLLLKMTIQIVDLHIKHVDFPWFSIVVLVYQKVMVATFWVWISEIQLLSFVFQPLETSTGEDWSWWSMAELRRCHDMMCHAHPGIGSRSLGFTKFCSSPRISRSSQTTTDHVLFN